LTQYWRSAPLATVKLSFQPSLRLASILASKPNWLITVPLPSPTGAATGAAPAGAAGISAQRMFSLMCALFPDTQPSSLPPLATLSHVHRPVWPTIASCVPPSAPPTTL